METETKTEQPMSFGDMTAGAATAAPPDDFEDASPIQLGQRAFQAGTPEMDASDVQIPRLRLAQGLTAEVTAQAAKPGQWVLAGYDAVDEVIVVPGLYNKGRERRLGQDEDSNRPVVCRSPDAKIGIGDPGNELAKVGKGCADCEFSMWTPNPRQAGKNLPPKCALQYTYVCWSITHQAMVTVTMQKTQEIQAQQINAFIQARGLGNFAIKMRGAPRVIGRNTFFVPIPTFHAMTKAELSEAKSYLALGSG